MSTRCTIHFQYSSRTAPEAIIYRHWDGYPESEDGVLADLSRFFTALEAQTPNCRFYDPSLLASRFLVWQADDYEHDNLLDFTSVRPLTEDPDDISFRYFVRCNGSKRPEVTWEAVRWLQRA